MKYLALLLCLAASTAFASNLDFVLDNETGRNFTAVYISSQLDEDWNGNLLGDGQVLKNGGGISVRFGFAENTNKWDLNLVDSTGGSIVFRDINLLDVKKITLENRDGEVSAVVE